MQGPVPVLRHLLLPLSCALPRSLPGSPRQATVPCQRDRDAAEGELCHSLLGRPRRRRGHRLCHLTAGTRLCPQGAGDPSPLASMLLCQPFAAVWSSHGSCLGTPLLFSSLCQGALAEPPIWWEAADRGLCWGPSSGFPAISLGKDGASAMTGPLFACLAPPARPQAMVGSPGSGGAQARRGAAHRALAQPGGGWLPGKGGARAECPGSAADGVCARREQLPVTAPRSGSGRTDRCSASSGR